MFKRTSECLRDIIFVFPSGGRLDDEVLSLREAAGNRRPR